MKTNKKAIRDYLKTATFKGSPVVFRERYSDSALVVKFKDLKPFQDLGFTDPNAEISVAIYYGEYAVRTEVPMVNDVATKYKIFENWYSREKKTGCFNTDLSSGEWWSFKKCSYRCIKSTKTTITDFEHKLEKCYNIISEYVEWLKNPLTMADYEEFKVYKVKVDENRKKINELKLEIKNMDKALNLKKSKERLSIRRKKAALKDF
jgi:hypothetical protein